MTAMDFDLDARVAAAMTRAGADGRAVCVAFSGGLDSTVLLHVLAALRPRLRLQLSAVHVHHGMQPDADAWVAHCAAACAVLGVALQVRRVRVAIDDPRGFEAAARAARHAVYADCAADFVALAHHRDDQAETVLLQAVRGAGVAGLAAMPACGANPSQPAARARLLRPLLDVGRDAVRAWADARGLRWVDDPSNADPRWRRNHVRHYVLAPLRATWPGVDGALARVAANAADADLLLQQMGDEDLARLVDAHDRIAVDALLALGTVRAANALRVWVARAGHTAPSRDALHEALRQLGDACADMPWQWRPSREAAYCLERHRGRLAWRAPAPAGSADVVLSAERAHAGAWLDWTADSRIDVAPGAALSLEAVRRGGGLRFVHRAGGERLRIAPRAATRAVKDWLREAGWSPAQRASLPIAKVGAAVVWVPGVGVADAFAAQPHEAAIGLRWCARATGQDIAPADAPWRGGVR
jgi:tRNA(Ile)-lysidine synthase